MAILLQFDLISDVLWACFGVLQLPLAMWRLSHTREFLGPPIFSVCYPVRCFSVFCKVII